MRSRDSSAGDGGSALPLVVVAISVLCSVVLGVARLGAQSIDRAQAETAADAAALAGAHHGWPSANRLAILNHGSLVSFTDVGGVVTVSVRVGAATATAAAQLGP